VRVGILNIELTELARLLGLPRDAVILDIKVPWDRFGCAAIKIQHPAFADVLAGACIGDRRFDHAPTAPIGGEESTSEGC